MSDHKSPWKDRDLFPWSDTDVQGGCDSLNHTVGNMGQLPGCGVSVSWGWSYVLDFPTIGIPPLSISDSMRRVCVIEVQNMDYCKVLCALPFPLYSSHTPSRVSSDSSYSVAQSCPTLCDPMDCSKSGSPVLHHLLECSNSLPLSWWCQPTILSSEIPFSSCLQSFLASGAFLMSWFFVSGGQSIASSASPSVIPVNIQSWFPLGLTGLIASLFKGLSRVFSSTTVWKHQFFRAQPSLQSNSHIHTWLLEQPQLWLDRLISPLPSNIHPPQHSAGKATISRKGPDTPLMCNLPWACKVFYFIWS